MRGKPIEAWGKLDRSESGEITGWHPLRDHCADVAACCNAFLRHSKISERLAYIAGQSTLTDTQISRLCVLAGLHDIGKYNNGFQAKGFCGGITAGHVSEILGLMYDQGEYVKLLVDSIGYRHMLDWVDDECTLISYLRAVFMHHGRPQRHRQIQTSLWKASGTHDPFAGMCDLRKCLQKWFPDAWHSGGDRLPESAGFQNGFYGLVTLSDWIASDVRFFPFTESEGEDRMVFSSERAFKTLKELRLLIEDDDIRTQGNVEFGTVFPKLTTPRPLQISVVRMASPAPGSVALIEAETGSGKTEAALMYFFDLYRRKLVDGLYFALPTRTAATQMHKRISEAISRLYPNTDNRPAVVLAVPGYLNPADVTCRISASADSLWDDDDNLRNHGMSWASEHPKRFLAGSIAVGTIDQVLLSALMVNHSHMRATALLRHLLVVDEVHASDHYMNALLRVVLNRHGKAGGHTLLMSATLGTETAETLLHGTPAAARVTYTEAVNTPYPRLTRTSSNGENSLQSIRNSAGKRIRVHCDQSLLSPESIASAGFEHARRGAKVLIIRNTVSGCVAVQQALEQIAGSQNESSLLFGIKGISAPHHSRFSREDRIALDCGIEKAFGKERKDGGCVAAATQTVQQSLDLDADLLITDICPMDVLLQRLGRLHRHHRDRPSGFDMPAAFVLVPQNRDLSAFIDRRTGSAKGPCGIGTVYSDLRILEATWRQLESTSTFDLPSDCRTLVESSVHTQVIDSIVSELGSPWDVHSQQVAGSAAADGIMAKLNIADWDLDFTDDSMMFPDSSSGQASSRLGVNDRIAQFDREIESPFGSRFRSLSVPYWMCDGGQADALPSDIDMKNSVIYFSFLGRRFIYDHFGLRLHR
jgi:CRISPR-associated endonuclease/helicase Cas3